MMEQPRKCAICSVALTYVNGGDLCDLHLGVGVLKVAVLVGDARYSDFRPGYNHRTMQRCDRAKNQMMMPPLIPLWAIVDDVNRRARLWLDGGDQGWERGAA